MNQEKAMNLMTSSPDSSLRTPRKFLVLFMLATMLVGGLSLGRFNLEYEVWGFLGEVRYWLFYILALLMIATLTMDRGKNLVPGSVKKCVFWIVILHSYIILTSFWAPDQVTAGERIPDILLLMGIVFLSPLIFRHSLDRNIEYLLKILWMITVIVFLGGLTDYWTDEEGLKAFWGGAIGSARIWGTGILCAFYLWVKKEKTYFLFPIPLFLAGVMSSGNRGAFMALAIAFFFLFLGIRKMLKIKKTLFSILLILPLLFLLSFLPFVQERLPLFWSSLWVNDLDNLGLENLYWADRDLLFSMAWKNFTDYPLIGGGLGSFELISGEKYPHNLILNIATDGGAVGLFLFFLVFILVIRRWSAPKKLEHLVAFSIGIFYFICSLLGGTYYDARFMWLFFLLYMMPALGDYPEKNLAERQNLRGDNG